MLRYNRTLELAVAQIMAQTLNHKQLSIACMGTPLHEMASACMGMGTDLGTLGEDRISGASVVINNIVGASVDHDIQVLHSEPKEDYTEVYSISVHTARYASYAGKVAENVKRTLMLAEQASGKIKAVFDDVNVLFSSNDRVIPINIVPMVGNGDLSNEADLIKYAETLLPKGYETVREAKTPCAYPEIPNIEELPIAEIIKTGVGSLDTQLKEWAVKGGASLIHKVYQYCFNSSTETVDPTGYVHFDSNMLEHFDPQATALDVAVALMLLAKNIDDVELEYSGNRLSLDEIKLGLTVTRQFAASNMIYQLERVQNGRKSGKVVYSYPKIASSGDDWSKTVYEIIVDKITYDQFLDEGGTPEIIFGSYVSQHAYLKDDLLAGSENFIKAWADGEQTLRHERTQSEIARLFRVIRERIYRDYNELPQEERASIDTGMVADELAIFNKHLTARGLNHLYDIIREVYCNIFYAGTEVQCLLRCIDEVNVPDGASKETVLRIAIIEYVSKWMMEQTEMVDFVDDPTGRGAGLNAFYSRMKDADEEDLLAGLNELMAEQEKQERLLDRIEHIRESGLISAGDIRYIRSVQPGLLSDLPAGTIFSAEPSTQGYEAGLNALTGKGGIIGKIISAIINVIKWILSKIFSKSVNKGNADVIIDSAVKQKVEKAKTENKALIVALLETKGTKNELVPHAGGDTEAGRSKAAAALGMKVNPKAVSPKLLTGPQGKEVIENLNKIKDEIKALDHKPSGAGEKAEVKEPIVITADPKEAELPIDVHQVFATQVYGVIQKLKDTVEKFPELEVNMDAIGKLTIENMATFSVSDLVTVNSKDFEFTPKSTVQRALLSKKAPEIMKWWYGVIDKETAACKDYMGELTTFTKALKFDADVKVEAADGNNRWMAPKFDAKWGAEHQVERELKGWIDPKVDLEGFEDNKEAMLELYSGALQNVPDGFHIGVNLEGTAQLLEQYPKAEEHLRKYLDEWATIDRKAGKLGFLADMMKKQGISDRKAIQIVGLTLATYDSSSQSGLNSVRKLETAVVKQLANTTVAWRNVRTYYAAQKIWAEAVAKVHIALKTASQA